MKKWSKRAFHSVVQSYRISQGLRPQLLWPSGLAETRRTGTLVDALPVVQQARRHALQEAVRWGEPYSFFLAPGVISWVVPVVDRYELWGGVLGGEVLSASDREDTADTVEHLIRHGAAPKAARHYVATLPVWPQARCQTAAEQLYALVYQVTGLQPQLLAENKERHHQQRQIAEEIHRRKRSKYQSVYADDEQVLLSLIRAGDRKGARRILNQMLGRVFLRSANLTIIRALTIEWMGYLVRRAVEDSPFLEPIMEQNHQWMAKILEAEDFESLAAVLRRALDDFMDSVYERGYADVNPRVSAAMEYLAGHFREPVTLADVAKATGVSAWRIAHLVREETGKSIIRHVHYKRIQESKRLLESGAAPCADIALEVGFCDQSYFTRQFRKYTGVTPAQYRRRAGAKGQGAGVYQDGSGSAGPAVTTPSS